MAKKRIDVSNRLSYTIIAVVALMLVSAGVYSYGTTNPSSFGHSIGEIGCSDAFCAKNGNIGIGTTTPAGLLHLYKTNGAADFVMAAGTGNWWWLSTSADSTKFLIGATGATRPADNTYPITISGNKVTINSDISIVNSDGKKSFWDGTKWVPHGTKIMCIYWNGLSTDYYISEARVNDGVVEVHSCIFYLSYYIGDRFPPKNCEDFVSFESGKLSNWNNWHQQFPSNDPLLFVTFGSIPHYDIEGGPTYEARSGLIQKINGINTPNCIATF
jgi:hypothetical protein